MQPAESLKSVSKAYGPRTVIAVNAIAMCGFACIAAGVYCNFGTGWALMTGGVELLALSGLASRNYMQGDNP